MNLFKSLLVAGLLVFVGCNSGAPEEQESAESNICVFGWGTCDSRNQNSETPPAPPAPAERQDDAAYCTQRTCTQAEIESDAPDYVNDICKLPACTDFYASWGDSSWCAQAKGRWIATPTLVHHSPSSWDQWRDVCLCGGSPSAPPVTTTQPVASGVSLTESYYAQPGFGFMCNGRQGFRNVTKPVCLTDEHACVSGTQR